MKLVYFFGLMLSLNNVKAQSNNKSLTTDETGNTLLWEISGNGITTPSYLYGTFHLLCNDDIHLSTALKQAIINSQEVYLELDLDDPATVLGALTMMNMKNGQKLKDLYTTEQYQRIADFFNDSLKTPIGIFQRIKPAFLLALLYPKMMPCSSASSVEESVMEFAKDAGKEIKGLETMAFQASIFDSIPYEEQASELLNTIDSMDRSKAYFSRMLAAYNDQRLHEIEIIVNTPEFGVESNQDILLDNRNKNWVLQLKDIMKREPVLTAVGAGHLVGINGLIALLKAEGYTVRGIVNK
jgi:uncharacterized protein YbaP (TraB family)